VGPTGVDQARRYATAGRDAHGDAFAGVRLVVLGALHTSAANRPRRERHQASTPRAGRHGTSRCDGSSEA